MRVGISLSSSIEAPDPQTTMDWMLERTRAAHRAGLDSLSLGDHHVRPPSYMQNTPTLGRLMPEWPDRPIGCLFLMPLWNPVLVAEHVGTLAAMTSAPFIVQTGIGSGQQQFAAMGADMSSRGRDTEEGIVRVQALLADEAADGVRVGPRPRQPVEWWIGAGGAPAGLRRAARLGDAWYGPPAATVSWLAEPMSIYLDACAEHGATPRPILRKDVIVSTDGARASRRADEIIAAGYRGMARDQVVAGSPDEVAAEFAALADCGVTDVIVRCMSVTQPEAVETIEGVGAARELMA